MKESGGRKIKKRKRGEKKEKGFN